MKILNNEITRFYIFAVWEKIVNNTELCIDILGKKKETLFIGEPFKLSVRNNYSNVITL